MTLPYFTNLHLFHLDTIGMILCERCLGSLHWRGTISKKKDVVVLKHKGIIFYL